MARAKSTYEDINATSKREMEAAKKAHDQLVDMQLMTVIITQAELFSRAAEELELLVSKLPQDKVCVGLVRGTTALRW